MKGHPQPAFAHPEWQPSHLATPAPTISMVCSTPAAPSAQLGKDRLKEDLAVVRRRNRLDCETSTPQNADAAQASPGSGVEIAPVLPVSPR